PRTTCAGCSRASRWAVTWRSWPDATFCALRRCRSMSPKLLAAAVALVAAAPSLSVHAIFSGGQTDDIHAGQALMAQVRDSGGQGVRSICWDPAPIGRPACGTTPFGAPAKAGPQKVVVTLSDQSTLTKTIDVLT